MENNETIGSYFKNARESKKLSLRDIADQTKININILQAIEENNLTNLPNKTYVRGFIQSYARTLGVAVDPAYELLNKLYNPKPVDKPILEQAEEIAPHKPEQQKTTQEIIHIQDKIVGLINVVTNKKYLTLVGVVIIGMFVLKGLYGFFQQLTEEKIAMKSQRIIKEVTTIKPKESSLFESDTTKEMIAIANDENKEKDIEEKVVVTEVIEEEPKKEEIVIAKVPEKKIVEPKKVTLKEKIEKSEEKKEEPKKVAKKINGKYPFINFKPAPKSTFSVTDDEEHAALLPNSIKNSYKEGIEHVFIRSVSGDTWLSYQVDGEKIRRFILKQDKTLLIRGENILLFLGNVNVTKIFYNNQPIEIKSRTGVKSLIFPQDYAEEISLPLFPNLNGVPLDQNQYKDNMAEAQNG